MILKLGNDNTKFYSDCKAGKKTVIQYKYDTTNYFLDLFILLI